MSTVSTDPIADMLTRIRNGLAVHKDQVSMPHSSIKESIAKILKETGYLSDVSVEKDGFRKTLTLSFAIDVSISEISRVSSPGRRVYATVKEIPRVKQGRGVVIVSTSSGVMTGDQAKAKKLGGEVLCSIY